MNISPEVQAILDTANKNIQTIKDSTKDMLKKEALDVIQGQIDKLKTETPTAEEFKTLEATLTKLTDEVKQTNLNYKSQKSGLVDGIKNFFKENAEKISSIYTAGSGLVKFKVDDHDVMNKAVGDITTGSATNPDGIPAIAGVQMAPPSNVNLREYYIEQLISRFNTNMAAYPYTDTLPKEGEPLYVAEGAAKPQIDFKIETRYAEPKRIAAWVRLTKDAIADIPRLESISRDYLLRQHNLKKQKMIINGDGVGENPTGMSTIGRLFVAGGMALKVTNTNIMDVINAAITDIVSTHNYTDEASYMANLAMISQMDFFTYFKAAKDERGLPLFPQAVLFNQVQIGDVTVKPSRDVADGYILVADAKRYKVTNYEPYNVTVGWVNDDFIKNQFVILAESRGHYFVQELDKQAFIYDQIETIKTAITAV